MPELKRFSRTHHALAGAMGGVELQRPDFQRWRRR